MVAHLFYKNSMNKANPGSNLSDFKKKKKKIGVLLNKTREDIQLLFHWYANN